MSLLSWLTGGTFLDNKDLGDNFFKEDDFGEAKLAYQRAYKKCKDARAEDIKHVKDKIALCGKKLAFVQIDNAIEFFKRGDTEQAFEIIDDIHNISEDEQVEKRVDEVVEKYEAKIIKEESDDGHEMTEEELLAVISGTWSASMSEEFSQMDESFHQALLMAHDGEFERAADLTLEAIKKSDDCTFAYFELAKQQLGANQTDSAIDSLLKFIDKVKDNPDTVEQIVLAYTQLGSLFAAKDDKVQAKKYLLDAYNADPENHVTLLHLGLLVREMGELKEAKQTLLNALEVMDSTNQDMRVFREIGLTCIALDEKDEAIDYLSPCIESLHAHGAHNEYDPESAIPLALLYEEKGELAKASDIYRHLATGYHKAGYFAYNLQSARLLKLQNADDELVESYLIKAKELAQTKEDQEKLAI